MDQWVSGSVGQRTSGYVGLWVEHGGVARWRRTVSFVNILISIGSLPILHPPSSILHPPSLPLFPPLPRPCHSQIDNCGVVALDLNFDHSQSKAKADTPPAVADVGPGGPAPTPEPVLCVDNAQLLFGSKLLTQVSYQRW